MTSVWWVCASACSGSQQSEAGATPPATPLQSIAQSVPSSAEPAPVAVAIGRPYQCGPDEMWRPTATIGAPAGRQWHGAVWTGTEMMIWGGWEGTTLVGSGALYNPATDTWRSVPSEGAPSPRFDMVMAWTGREVLIWGGRQRTVTGYRDGARFDPQTGRWTPMSAVDAPPPTLEPRGLWTGRELIVWGDDTVAGARYDPVRDRWVAMSRDGTVPAPRDGFIIVWSGEEVLVWGGRAAGNGKYVNSGGRYSPTADRWTAMSEDNAPTGTYAATGVWSGTELLIFGGRTCGMDGCDSATSGRYSPASNSWRRLSEVDAPAPRHFHTGVWTGRHMLIWGGSYRMHNSGGLYDPALDRWRPLTRAGAPAGRYLHSGLWTDAGLIVWGGTTPAGVSAGDGGVYCPPASAR